MYREMDSSSRVETQQNDPQSASHPAARGQAYTLEGVVAAGLLIGALVIVTQSAALTPLSASNTDYQIQYQQQLHATDILDTSKENGALREALLYYDADNSTFIGSPETQTHYTAPPTDTRFGQTLTDVFINRQTAVNVNIHWIDTTGAENTVRYLDMGEPSDSAITATQSIVLTKDDHVAAPAETTLGDIARDENLEYAVSEGIQTDYMYRTLKVEITVWRI